MISHRVQKRLTHEVHEALALRDKRGQSKHKDKQAARKAAQDNHTAYKTITGLYATTSLTTYARQATLDVGGCGAIGLPQPCRMQGAFASLLRGHDSTEPVSVDDTHEGLCTVRRVRAALSRTVRGRKPADTPPRRYNAGANTKRKQ